MGGTADVGFARLMWTATAVTTIGMLPVNLLPILVGSWIKHLGASPAGAGAIGALELGAMALAAMLLSVRIHAISRRRIAVCAGLLVLSAHLASIQVTDLRWLLLLRGLAGLGEGALLGTVAATISGSRDPERLYAWVAIAGSFIAVAMWLVVPVVVARAGAAGAFGAMAFLTALCVPFYAGLPSHIGAGIAGSQPAPVPVSTPSPKPSPTPTPMPVPAPGSARSRSGLMLAVAGILVAAGQSAVWSFSERIAAALGISSGMIGWIFGAATLAGTLGAFMAAVIGADRGRRGPLLSGYLGILLAIGLVTSALSSVAFIAGQIVFSFFYFFVSPYVMGLAADLDRSGRVASALSGALLIGAGLGPLLGGLLVQAHSYAMLGGIGAGLVVVSGTLLIANEELRGAVWRVDRADAAEGLSPP